MKKFLCASLVATLLFCLCLPISVSASTDNEKKIEFDCEVVNAGNNTGYSEENKITSDDPHYKWSIGKFFVTGHSDYEKDANGNFVFLKNVGDKVTLWFCLTQDIDCLNNNDKLSISEDVDGYDEHFSKDNEKSNLGRGALFIRKKNSENQWEECITYTNYLEAHTSKDAYTQVELFEEGDYEVALDYEVKKTNINIFGWKPFPSFYNYRIFFRFSVRNGNCMVYPFDVSTKAELSNAAYTENGFYLDLANSQYLDIIVKREILTESADGLVEDVRFNRPAKDGETFTEDGIYTITVTNEYTNQETIKKIYVGTNSVMKAYVTTGFSIEEINQQLALGATINENGELIAATVSDVSVNSTDMDRNNQVPDYSKYLYLAGTLLLIVIALSIVVIINKNKRHKNNGGKK